MDHLVARERGEGRTAKKDDSLDFSGKTLFVFFFVYERFEMLVGISKLC